MASVSIRAKSGGKRYYAKFADKGYMDVHLGKDKKTALMMLKATFDRRQYIESGKMTAAELDKFIKRIEDSELD